MKVKIRETGKIEDLSITSNGVNWVNDLVGNAGAFDDGQFVYEYDEDVYVADQTTFDWWAGYIADTNQTDREIAELSAKIGVSESDIRERIAAEMAGVNDYEDHRKAAVRAMREMAQ